MYQKLTNSITNQLKEGNDFSNFQISTVDHGNFQYGLEGRVLVLNQSYEPLTICSPKRAVTLVFLYKAEIIEFAKGKLIRTPNSYYRFPSVIKLNQYRRVPYKTVVLSRKNVLRRDNHTCQYCGTKNSPMTMDHILPKSRGGDDSWENLITACFRCNNLKGNRTPKEAGMKLRSIPQKPHYILYMAQKLGNPQEEWKQFMYSF